MIRYDVPRGTRDFLPYDSSAASGTVVRNYVERVLRETFESFGYQEIQTPTFESFDLFAARSGEEIRESMFTFASDAGRYALRPELTAPVCRVVASDALLNCDPPLSQPYKLYYFGPCFRYCKPQPGRFREFVQAGIELMGAADELADAEAIALAVKIFRRLGIDDYRIKVGNVGIFRQVLNGGQGANEQLQDWQLEVIHDIDWLIHVDETCRSILAQTAGSQQDLAYLQRAAEHLHKLQAEIDYAGAYKIHSGGDASAETLPQIARDTLVFKWNSELSLTAEKGQLLLHLMGLRGPSADVLPRAREILAGTGADGSLDHLAKVCDWLRAFGVHEFDVVLGTVRNLDFYTGTVFEIDSDLLGAKKQVCGGGRYDNLVEEFGGSKTPATGFAFGFDRLVEVFTQSQSRAGLPVLPLHLLSAVDVVAVAADSSVRPEVVRIAEALRDAGLRAATELSGRDFDGQIEYARQMRAEFSVIVDRDGIAGQNCKLRHGSEDTGITEQIVPVAEVAEEIKRRRRVEKI